MIVLPRASHAGQVAVILRPRPSPFPAAVLFLPATAPSKRRCGGEWGGGACVEHHSPSLSMEYQASVVRTDKVRSPTLSRSCRVQLYHGYRSREGAETPAQWPLHLLTLSI